MDFRQIGMNIEYERNRLSWSQEGLCKGICSVSYLSKIENGVVNPSLEIIDLLYKRLNIKVDEEIKEEAKKLRDELKDAYLKGEYSFKDISSIEVNRYKACLEYIDILLLTKYFKDDWRVNIETDEEFNYLTFIKNTMDEFQRGLYHILNKDYPLSIKYYPSAITYFSYATNLYWKGDYLEAIRQLEKAYGLSSLEGYASLMMEIKFMLGSSYSNILKVPEMKREYQIALNLADSLGNKELVKSINYNINSTIIGVGLYEEAYEYFKKCEIKSELPYHKLAVCCSKLGKVPEGKEAIKNGRKILEDKIKRIKDIKTNREDIESYNKEESLKELKIYMDMLDIVEMRLDNLNYLDSKEYGEKLIKLFNDLRKNFHAGFAIFHLNFMVEWYKYNRQYKKIIELISDFPENANLIDLK